MYCGLISELMRHHTYETTARKDAPLEVPEKRLKEADCIGMGSRRALLDGVPYAGHEGPRKWAGQLLSVFRDLGFIIPTRVDSVTLFHPVDSVAEIR
jgi:hypothetical protein